MKGQRIIIAIAKHHNQIANLVGKATQFQQMFKMENILNNSRQIKIVELNLHIQDQEEAIQRAKQVMVNQDKGIIHMASLILEVWIKGRVEVETQIKNKEA